MRQILFSPHTLTLAGAILAGLALAGSALAGSTQAEAPPPYYGLWGSTANACHPRAEGVHTVEINRDGLYWYETRCKATSMARQGPRTWSMRLTCEGEGERSRARPRLTLADPDKLVIEGSPVTPTKWQSYVRCKGR